MPDDLLTRVERLEARLAAVEAENASLRAGAGSGPATTPATTAAPPTPPPSTLATDVPAADPTVGRRQALRTGLGLAGAAAAGAVLADAAPAAAAPGNPVIQGVTNNSGAEATTLTGSGTLVLGVGANTNINAFRVFNAGIGYAITAESRGDALLLVADRAHLTFGSSSNRLAPTTDTHHHRAGEVVFDGSGVLWFCTASGTPGTWRVLGGPGFAGALAVLPSPVRIYDSRPGTAPAQGPKAPLPANGTRVLDLKVNGSGVTAGVTAAVLNVLLVNATAGAGNATVWAAGQPKPQANTLVWGGNAGRYSTQTLTAVDPQGRIQVNASLRTNVVIDVVGYYR